LAGFFSVQVTLVQNVILSHFNLTKMKNLRALMLLAFFAVTAPVFAQTATPAKPATNKTTVSTKQTGNDKTTIKVKADGTPDKRYAENKKLKADGTPDKRYSENKNLKKDGTPDKRYKTSSADATKAAKKP
jgi:biopolymer transport protein ExbD